MSIVTLITDFGTRDGYVGEVKGVLLSRCAGVSPVDVAHDLPAGDVAAGAWALQRIWDRFPHGTVHLVVVDPGVGGRRRAVAVRAGGRWFVGPDNGLLTRVAARAVPEEARGLDPARIGLPDVSDTFHGRDLFAPAAAHLACGGDPRALGPGLDPASLVLETLPEPRRRGREIVGRVVHVDRFGNLVTDVPSEWLPASPSVEVGGTGIARAGRAFADVAPGEAVLIRGSGGTLEVAVRDGSAAEALGAERGTAVRVRPAAEA
jgi:S-adenosylmethionine hydrolase